MIESNISDIALELVELVKDRDVKSSITSNKGNKSNKDTTIDGVEVKTKTYLEGKIKESIVEVLNDKGSISINKPCGTYITIESQVLDESDKNAHDKLSKVIAKDIEKIAGKLNIDKKEKDINKVLVIGLGNKKISVDSLGPEVAENIIVTRHLKELLTDKEIGDIYTSNTKSNKVKEISSMVPGVMGMTGIESSDIIKSITKTVKPDLVIVVDALASSSISRLNRVVQLTDAGISPGSGVGNKRREITSKSLKVPTIAIGVPTVITINSLLRNLGVDIDNYTNTNADTNTNKNVEDSKKDKKVKESNNKEQVKSAKDIIRDYSNLCITLKEEDQILSRIKQVLISGINLYLHKNLDIEDIASYLY